MRAQELLAVDPGLALVTSAQPQIEYEALCVTRSAGPRKALFVKNARFHKEAADASLPFQEMALIYDKALWESLLAKEDAYALKLKSMAGALFTTTSVEMGMCRLSLPFFQRLHAGLNDEVDGRQMGTAQVHPTASIAQNVFLGEGVVVGAGARLHSGVVVQSKSVVGEGTEVFPNVVIYRFSKIGKGCRIHAGSVIGADGFGYNFHQGTHHKIWHMGGVEIGDDVEIGAGSAVDQGTFAPTTIGPGTRIDNQVQVGHNCRIGRGVILCGQVGIAGSTVLEDYVVVGGGAGIGPDLVVGRGTQVAGMAGLNTDTAPGSAVGGHPARPVKEWLRGVAYVRRHSLERGEK